MSTKTKIPKANTTFRNGDLFCLNCGGSFHITYPIQPEMLTGMTKSFNGLHANCKPGWKEPNADQTKSISERAQWWISNGHVGMSSKFIWTVMMNIKPVEINYPHDPDDFSRCYALLKAVPEWRSRLPELGQYSRVWSRLAANWDKLTDMYEQNQREDWKNAKKVGMYDFMQTLIDQS